MRKKRLTLVQKLRGEIEGLKKTITEQLQLINKQAGEADESGKYLKKCKTLLPEFSKTTLNKYNTAEENTLEEAIVKINDEFAKLNITIEKNKTESTMRMFENNKLWYIIRHLTKDETLFRTLPDDFGNIQQWERENILNKLKTPFD